jgi:flagellar basal-body rod protein FlgF
MREYSMSDGISELAKICIRTMSQLDVVSHNLANIATPGFKVEHIYQGEAKGAADKGGGNEAFLFVDHSPGLLQKTDNALDVAIQGEGFFVIETKAGLAYTRKGNFTLNKNNQLVTRSGDNVLGDAGPITIAGRNVSIDGSGTITVDGTEAGKLQMVSFDNRQNLIRRGDGLFTDPGSAGKKKTATPDFIPRHLELANVNAILEMADMIDIQRSFESYQKVMLTIQDMDKLSTSRVGRLA